MDTAAFPHHLQPKHTKEENEARVSSQNQLSRWPCNASKKAGEREKVAFLLSRSFKKIFFLINYPCNWIAMKQKSIVIYWITAVLSIGYFGSYIDRWSCLMLETAEAKQFLEKVSDFENYNLYWEHCSKYTRQIKADVGRSSWPSVITVEMKASIKRALQLATYSLGMYDQSMAFFAKFFYYDFIRNQSLDFIREETRIACLLYVWLNRIKRLFARNRAGSVGVSEISCILKSLLRLYTNKNSAESLTHRLSTKDFSKNEFEDTELEFFNESINSIGGCYLDVVDSLGLCFLPVEKSILLFDFMVGQGWNQEISICPITIGSCAIAVVFTSRKAEIFCSGSVFEIYSIIKDKWRLKPDSYMNELNGPANMQEYLAAVEEMLLLREIEVVERKLGVPKTKLQALMKYLGLSGEN